MLLYVNVSGQVAKSFYYNGDEIQRTGSYVEAHPSNSTYFIGSSRRYGNYSETILSNLDSKGNTIWHATTKHFGVQVVYSGVTDVKVNNSNVFISSYAYSSNGPDRKVKIYKYDFNGNKIDSLIISSPVGIKKISKNELSFDSNGNLITIVKDLNNDIIFYKINVSNMSVITQQIIGNSTVSIWNSRGLFVETNNSKSYLAFGIIDSVKFVSIDDNSGSMTQFSVPTVGGILADIEIYNSEIYLLVNTNIMGGSNPLRIIKTSITGTVLNDDSYTLQNDVNFENMSIDANGDIYVCYRSQFAFNNDGGIAKIDNQGLNSQFSVENTNLTEIEIQGNDLLLAGNYENVLQSCMGGTVGTLFGIHPKNSNGFIVIAPHMVLMNNNIEAIIGSTSINFNDNSIGVAGYSINGAGTTIYNNSFVITGIDANATVKSSYGSYFSLFVSGPITNTIDYTTTERDQWDRVWMITKAQVDLHIQAYQLGNASYATPEVILNWPGNGDVNKGQSSQLAHYKDINGNGVYEPLMGEYPMIKGDYCALSIYNDNNSVTDSICVDLSEKVNIQVAEYAYGFDCSQDSSIQNTTFIYYEIVNYSGADLIDTYVGHYIDFDINSPTDDFIGTDVSRSAVYGMNATAVVGPEQAYVILGSTQNTDGIDNPLTTDIQTVIAQAGSPYAGLGFGYGDGVVDNERLGMTNSILINNGAVNVFDFLTNSGIYNAMQSIYQDGSHMKYGSPGSTNIDADYVVPGESDPLHYGTGGISVPAWSEIYDTNAPGNRRALASSGGFTFIDTILFDVCYVTGMQNVAAGYTSHETMLANIDSINSYFNSNETACGQNFDFYEPFDGPYLTIGIPQENNNQVSIYPNPNSGQFSLNGARIGAEITIYDLNGKMISSTVVISDVTLLNIDEQNGIYIVSIKSNNEIQYIKVVKQ